jgi:hypothetical protein
MSSPLLQRAGGLESGEEARSFGGWGSLVSQEVRQDARERGGSVVSQGEFSA